MRIAVIGATVVDIVSYVDKIPKYVEAVTAKDFHVACGGKGANQAIAAKRLGADVLMVSTIGDDLFGKTALKNFRQNGINTQHITKVENVSNGVVMIVVESSGQYRSIFYLGASNFLTPKNIFRAADDLKKCGLFVIQLEIALETVYAAIDFANKNNILVLLNPSPINKNFSVEKVCPCEFFVLNENELKSLTELPIDSRENIRIAAKKLLAYGIKILS